MVHACEVANEAEKATAIRRASGFNELFEAAVKKECNVEREDKSGSAANKGKEKQFDLEVKALKEYIVETLKTGDRKWTWGVDLTDEDLRDLIRGADRGHQVSHSGYDEDLPSSSASGETSSNLEDKDVRFESISKSITIIPALHPLEIPDYSLLSPECYTTDSEPDPVIEAFAKRAKAKTKSNKLVMQDEVDQPASFLDYGSEFIPRIATIPRRPWLATSLPIILPPTNKTINHITPADPDTDLPSIPESDDIPDHMSLPDSDDNPDHSMSPKSGSPSSLNFPVSDEEMDVVRSDNADSDSDAVPDHIVISPSPSPVVTRHFTRSPGMMTEFQRDPTTGRFTADSFANFPDEALD
jgi:hypothetical protein